MNFDAMKFDDLQNALTGLIDATRHTLRVQLTSPWLPIQLGIILVAILLAMAARAVLRRNFDPAAAMAGWPSYMRALAGRLTQDFTTLMFILLVSVARIS